ncbi:hypothetical protein [Lysobacter sp. Hz 25]|uniref:hypothetical protein n=1 Tax=Lysobacter sp. Hz 25 TaxID=3383698 RepID=UPI0038D38487
MVGARVVHFDVVWRGPLNWRVSVNGDDEHVPFASKETCVAAARARARQRHHDTGMPTEVRAPALDGALESVVTYMLPEDLLEYCVETESGSSRQLREACDVYGLVHARP